MRRAGSGNFWSNLFRYAGNGGASGLATDVASARTALGLGTVATLNSIATANIDNDAVTLAKIQNIATNRLLGRTTAASGDAEEITPGFGIIMAALGITAGLQVAVFQDEKADGTDGGTSTAGSYQTRALNTTVLNTITGASLAANQVTLTQAGTYFMIGLNTGYTRKMRGRIRNVTDSTNVGRGGASDMGTSGFMYNVITFGAQTIAANKTFQLQYQVDTGRATDGLGIACNFGETEVYGMLGIVRIA